MIPIKDINLLPEEVYIADARRKKNIARLLLVILFFVVITGVYVQMAKMESVYESKIRSLYASAKERSDMVKGISRIKELQDSITVLKGSVDRIRKSRFDWPGLLNDIAISTPANLSIVNLAADARGMKIAGEAKSEDDIALFIKNLKSLDYIYDIKPALIQEESSGLLSFVINIQFKVK
ncbi:PilN domain-containing protein [Caldanaerobius polysaccharolyticus]|uniref:PilN domain-containing protein n=1 Tax=Caldanaerobius polysaccharolyticus TaxID=44256 RepID=UPI00047A4726|nr:PilN domain-containing protein [Caldanaerobius polysaccharolyticus]